jgi:predicted TIM-barrel fold metal-dependent hydrolase
MGEEATDFRETAIDPGLPIIDPHHHLWDFAHHRYRAADFAADAASGHNILGTVFIECGAEYRTTGPEAMRPLGEVEFVVQEVAAAAAAGIGPKEFCAGIIGHADLREPSTPALLDAEIAAAGGRFRGIRHCACFDLDTSFGSPRTRAPKDMLASGEFRRGLAELAPRDLSYEAWLYFPQLSEIAALAGAFPDTQIVLDHVGAPIGAGVYAGRTAEIFPVWKAGVLEVARRDNVVVKLGGLGMPYIGDFGFDKRRGQASSAEMAEAWRPYVETCLDAFGVDRAMFESNFPVDKPSCSYVQVWNAFKRLAAGYSADEKRKLFYANARAVYRLDRLPEIPPAAA